MSDQWAGVTSGLTGATTAPGHVRGLEATRNDRQEIQRLAQEFEALLMTQMVRDMRRAMLSEESESTDWSALSDTLDVEYGRALSKAGGIGLANALLGAFERLAERSERVDGVEARPSENTTPTRPEPHAAEHSARLGGHADGSQTRLELPGTVTSDFGWRRDPFSGAARFHAGVDVAMAYGQDVAAAAEGRVVFAGERGGYGNLVVIEHREGRETRYAHLSEQFVSPGDLVGPGQVIGRAGSSGRATGPHLHFEVLDHGRPADPAGLDWSDPGASAKALEPAAD